MPIITPLRRCIPVLALLGICGALAPAASATSAPASAASTQAVTDATTGLADASSVVPLDACGTPTAVRAACLTEVLGVRGTKSLVHPRLRRPASPNRLSRHGAAGSRAVAQAVTAAGAPQPGTPAYLQQVYNLAYLSQTAGSGATIAIVDAYDAPNAEADLNHYRQQFALPPCTSDTGCFTKVDQNGGQNYPPSSDAGWELETSLDLDAVSALCPNCRIVLVEAHDPGVSNLATAQATAASFSPSVISDSWAVALSGRGSAAGFESTGDYTFPGITTVAASGDDGYLGSRTDDYPAALSDVVAAGGTTLLPGSTSPRGFDESAWSKAGSGCDPQVAKPAWQTDTGCSGRSYADVSADADPATGMQVYDTDEGGWVVVGGTSAAAPLIAGFYVLAGSAGQGADWAYANAANLNDPASGSNGSCSQAILYICTAGSAYDGPTGIGSISGAVAPGAPGIGGPGPNGSYTQGVSATGAQLQGGVYPNGTDTTYWWEYGTTTSYGAQTLATGVGPGTAAVPAAGALIGLQPGTTYHYRLVAENSFGTEYGYDYTLTTSSQANNSSTQGSGTGTQSNPSAPPGTTTSPTTPSSPPSTGPIRSAPARPALARLRVALATANSATLAAGLTTGGAGATYSLEYGTTTALGRSVRGSLGASSTGLSGTLRNLAPGRTYYVRAVLTNSAGSTASATIRFRTSPVTITRLVVRGNTLQAVLRCYGSASCRVRLQALSGSRLIASGPATVRGNRSATVSLALRGKHQAVKLLVLSSWNGYPAVVTATS